MAFLIEEKNIKGRNLLVAINYVFGLMENLKKN